METNDIYLSVDGVTEENCISLANHLIGISGSNYPPVEALSDIRSIFFFRIFERIFSVEIPEIKTNPVNYEEEWANLNAILDTLAMDILHLSLTHIDASAILEGRMYAINDFLQCFYLIINYCIPKENDTVPDIPEQRDEDNEQLKETVVSNTSEPVHKGKHSCEICGYEYSKYVGADVCVLCPRCKLHDENRPLESSVFETRPSISYGENQGMPSVDMEEGTLHTLSQEDNKSFLSACFPDEIYEMQKQKSVGRELFCGSVDERQDLGLPETPIGGLFAHDQAPPPFVHMSDVAMVDGTTVPKALWHDEMVQVSMPCSSLAPHLENGISVSQNKETQTSDIQQLRKKKHVTMKRKHFPYPEQNEVARLYQKNFEYRLKPYLEDRTHYQERMEELEKKYFQLLKKPKPKYYGPMCRKSFLLPHYLRHRGRSARSMMQNSSSDKAMHNKHQSKKSQSGNPDESAFLKGIREAFPGVNLSPHTIQVLEMRHAQHLNHLHKELKEALLLKPPVQKMAKEAIEKQKKISEILKKDLHHKKKVEEEKENRLLGKEVNALPQKRRLQSAKAAKYFQELHTGFEKKLEGSSSAENVLVHKVAKEHFNLENKQVLELKKELKEKLDEEGSSYEIYLAALENFYQSQYAMLKEEFAAENEAREQEIRALKEQLDAMKRENRAQMEQEIHQMQSEILRLQEDARHFRELEAEQYIDELRDRFSALPLG